MSVIERAQMQKKLNRARLIEFEKEIEERLDSLNNIDSEMHIISEQRKDWLDNISKNHISGSDIYTQRVNLVKAQAEQLSLTLKLDVLKLESQYETQRLAKLMEFTRPLSEGETEDDRVEALKLQARKDSDSLKVLLQYALDHRLQISHLSTDLLQHLSRLQHQSELEQEEKANDLSEHLHQYCENMSHSIQRASGMYGDIIREYLILRHNAQVAKEILLRNQNDAMFSRQELQMKLQKLSKDAIAKRRKHESAAAKELKLKLTELRGEVMRKEKLLEEMKLDVRELKRTKKGEVTETTEKIKAMKKRFMKLQESRREVKLRTSGEVDALRHAVQELSIRQSLQMKHQQFIMDDTENNVQQDVDDIRHYQNSLPYPLSSDGLLTDVLPSSQILREQVKTLLHRLEAKQRAFRPTQSAQQGISNSTSKQALH